MEILNNIATFLNPYSSLIAFFSLIVSVAAYRIAKQQNTEAKRNARLEKEAEFKVLNDALNSPFASHMSSMDNLENMKMRREILRKQLGKHN